MMPTPTPNARLQSARPTVAAQRNRGGARLRSGGGTAPGSGSVAGGPAFEAATANALVADAPVAVRISFGAAIAAATDESPEDLLERADRELYAAKVQPASPPATIASS